MSPNDALTFSVAERRLDKRIDELERRLSESKVELHLRAEVEVELPRPPRWPGRIALLSLAVAVVSLVLAVTR